MAAPRSRAGRNRFRPVREKDSRQALRRIRQNLFRLNDGFQRSGQARVRFGCRLLPPLYKL